jgi:hypothetical protein
MSASLPTSVRRRSGPVRPRSVPGLVGLCALLAFAFLASAAEAEAQQAQRTQYQQVISANPFGLLLEFFNAEYERVATESSTAGFGGSFFDRSDDTYLNADVFWRYYPQGTPLDGWAFGAKMGLTRITAQGSFFGFGFDVNRSWLLGANENFYVGIGIGLKRLLGASDVENAPAMIPTIRLVNVGFAF